MIIPPKLKPGDKVALVAPARWPAEAQIKGLADALKRHGFEPYTHPQVYERPKLADGRFGQLAGPDEIRATAFNDMLRDPSVKGIFFPRAGTGSYRILDMIDYKAIADNPKIIMGYSDVDILLAAIAQKAGVITFRGPMGVNFSKPDMDPRTETECFELLTGKRMSWVWEGATALREGTAEGELVGGNLAVINANIGGPFEVDMKGKIVILEECDELTFRIDRFLCQVAPKLAQAKAVLFGTAENMIDAEDHDGSGNPFGDDIPTMLRRWVPKNIPLATGLPLGHGSYLSSHPVGVLAGVEVGKTAVKLQLLAPAVS